MQALSWSNKKGPRLWFMRTLLVSMVLLVSACSTLNEKLSEGSNAIKSIGAQSKSTMPSDIDSTIVEDLAGIVSQIYDPLNTTLQVSAANSDPTLQYFMTLFGQEGFGIQRVSADQGANYVSYTREPLSAGNDNEISFSVSVGAVSVTRDYRLVSKKMVAPLSVYKLSGTRAPVTVTDIASSRKQVSDPALAQAQYVASLGLDEQAPIISLITPELVEQVAAKSIDGPSLQALNSSKIEVNNLFYGAESTFASLLDDYEKVHKQVIIFGNDSMILGGNNKSLIDHFVENELQQGDVVSLIGCSNGPTALEIGNEGLALGRAQRVTEALMARGVARENVLDEGCWAPVNAEDRFPNRGVVLELWRRDV